MIVTEFKGLKQGDIKRYAEEQKKQSQEKEAHKKILKQLQLDHEHAVAKINVMIDQMELQKEKVKRMNVVELKQWNKDFG